MANHTLHHVGVDALDRFRVLRGWKDAITEEGSHDISAFRKKGLFHVSTARRGGNDRVRWVKRFQCARKKFAADKRKMVAKRERLALHV